MARWGTMANRFSVGERDVRPWGEWEVLDVTEHSCIKRIRVRPGQRLSLQRHRHRREFWLVVRGRARVERDGETIELGPGEHVVIPLGCWHRVANPGDGPLEFVEVQTGAHLDEDDIERREDDYGRV